MPDFTAWDPEDWSALGSMATALIAMVAAVFAFFQVREARRTRRAQAQPFVVVDIAPSNVWGNILNLIIENVGTTLARDVIVKFDPPIATSIEDYSLASSDLIRHGIRSLPPRRRVEILFDLSHKRIGSGLPDRYEVEVNFKDYQDRAQEPLRYVIDLAFLNGLERVDEYGIHHAADALRKIEKTLKSWNRTGTKPTVDRG